MSVAGGYYTLDLPAKSRAAIASTEPRGFGARHFDIKASYATFALDNYRCANASNQRVNPEYKLHLAPVRPFGKWFESVFGRHAVGAGPLMWGGVFAGTRDAIHSTPLALYKLLLKQVGEHSNPEVGHYIERIWGMLMFGFVVVPDAYQE